MPPDAGLPCVAIDTGTREADTHEARLTTERVVPELVQAQIAYKKIDSTLRGPWAAELACIMQTGAFSTCIFAPAFPQQGRITRLGRQLLRCTDGSYSVLPVNPAELLENKKFLDIVQKHVDERNVHLAKYESIKSIRIVKNDFSQEGGELTPSLKIKRKVVLQKYNGLIDDMYGKEAVDELYAKK